jgi:methionyl-tRNA synthetase
MLASLGQDFTRKLLVHGTIFGPDGQKMSKTRGNVVAPLEQYEKFGSDTCRFYMLGVLRPYADCSYREEDLINAHNAHLANNYGNLLNRLVHLGNKKEIDILDESKVSSEFRGRVSEMKRKAEKAYEGYELHDAVSTVNEMVSLGNQYIHEKEPWKKQREEAEEILNDISLLLHTASELYEPIIPEGVQRARRAIMEKEKVILYPRIEE